MIILLLRHDGPIDSMPTGSWSPRSNAAPVARCPSCGGIDEMSSTRFAVSDRGMVTPVYVCPTETCRWVAPIALADWP